MTKKFWVLEFRFKYIPFYVVDRESRARDAEHALKFETKESADDYRETDARMRLFEAQEYEFEIDDLEAILGAQQESFL